MISIQEKVWSSDWLVGLTVGVVILLVGFFNGLPPLEKKVYDIGISYMSRNLGSQIAVIAIDEDSLTQLGDWPWPRSIYAKLIDLVAPYSRAIALTLDLTKAQGEKAVDNWLTEFSNPDSLVTLVQETQKFDSLMEMVKKVRGKSLTDRQTLAQFTEFYQSSKLFSQVSETLISIKNILTRVTPLESDEKLRNSLKKAGNVVLGMPFLFGETTLVANLPQYLFKHRLSNIRDQFDNHRQVSQPLLAVKGIAPLVSLGESATAIGYVNFQAGDARQIPLVIQYNQTYFPSLALALAAKWLQLNNEDIEVRLGEGIRLGDLRINTDPYLQMKPFFYPEEELRIDSFADVLTGRVNAKKYQDKIVLIGVTAPPYSILQATPRSEMPSVVALAHQVASILNQDFLIVPKWAIWLQVGSFIVILAYLCLLLPRLNQTKLAWECSLVLMMGLGVIYFSLLQRGWVVSLLPAFLLILVGHLALVIKWGIVAYQDAFRLRSDAVESNRLLGLAFQGQGHLDLAFEKFRLCPPDESVMGLLYNLALDYELKRQYRRAGAVYRYLVNQDPHFRDAEQRLERLQSLRRPKLRGLGNNLSDWLLEEGNDKPMLGRYQIERELGRGAMGVVYLGKDSKLDRLVAIKTFILSQEFEGEELEEAAARFFREATAAGRLKHANIISIYEAGEEQDVAYIAMEFFKGGNLVPYTKPDNLLPMATVVQIVISIAEALDYAESQGVVHRDIKPANIMYNPATEQIKLTDFGIARITDSNKTKTGVILGTPSYMSPEQLAGKRLDGRSDLFSLGAMLYQLLTGVLPFQADSMTTLMFKIANESHLDITTVRADIPECLKRVVDKALQKSVKERFQSGGQFAQALRDCQRGLACA